MDTVERSTLVLHVTKEKRYPCTSRAGTWAQLPDSQCVPTSLHYAPGGTTHLQRPDLAPERGSAPAVRAALACTGLLNPSPPGRMLEFTEGEQVNKHSGGCAVVTDASFRSHYAHLNMLVVFAQMSINWELPSAQTGTQMNGIHFQPRAHYMGSPGKKDSQENGKHRALQENQFKGCCC